MTAISILDIKETQIGHFPSVWTDNDVGYMPISDSEDAALFTLTDFYGNNDLLFWFVPLNLVHNTPLWSERIPLDVDIGDNVATDMG